MGRFHHHPGPPPRGFSLLELLLALSLTVVVLVLVNMAVDLHLRSLDSRRAQLEEAQLARAILRMIAEDLRGAVQHHEQDMSGVQTLLQQSVSAGAASLGASAEAITSGGMPSDPSTGASPPADATLAAGSSAMAGGAPTTGTRDSSAPANTGNAGAAGEMSGAGSGSAMEPGANTADLAATTIPPVPGLFGNQFQLQVDVSRLPRIEEYQRYLTEDAATEVVDIPSDVKTVTYFVQSTPTGSDLGGTQPLEDLSDPAAAGTGLVRRVLDRSVTLWAMNNGNFAGLQNSGEVVAPEVAAIEFQYFDGVEWLPEWDTEVEQQLPVAVLVILALRTPGAEPAADVIPSTLTPDAMGGLHLYRMLVPLPAGGQPSGSGTADATGSGGTAETGGTL